MLKHRISKVALVYDWPERKTSELDIVKRIRLYLDSLDIDSFIVSPLGELLDDDCCFTNQIADIDEVDLSLHFHYTSLKLLDCFSYMLNWNPLGFFLNHPISNEPVSFEQLSYYGECLRSHDVLLSAGCKEVDEFAEALNTFNRCNYDAVGGPFHTTCLTHKHLSFPELSSFKVFYISANWERQLNKDRHGSLLELMDESGKFSFYGLRESNGKFLWKGISHYKGELPFDGGESIINASNECGVSLVLHSPAHHHGGVVSTRIFQAAAAKTIIIADDNPWIKQHFGDSVLTYKHDYSDDQHNFKCIMGHIEWIERNPAEAMEKAAQSNMIFEEKFSMESEVNSLLNNHADIIYDLSENKDDVSVFYMYSSETFNDFIRNIKKQSGVSVCAAIYLSSNEDKILVNNSLAGCGFTFTIYQKTSYVCENEGECLAHFIKHSSAASDFFCICSGEYRWNSDHLRRLVLSLKGSEVLFARSSVLVDYSELYGLRVDYAHLGRRIIDEQCRPMTYYDYLDSHECPSDVLLFSFDLFAQGELNILKLLNKRSYYYLLWFAILENNSFPQVLPFFTIEKLKDIESSSILEKDGALIDVSLSKHRSYHKIRTCYPSGKPVSASKKVGPYRKGFKLPQRLAAIMKYPFYLINSQLDTEVYLRDNPDVVEFKKNPLWHYLAHGAYEGRNISAKDKKEK